MLVEGHVSFFHDDPVALLNLDELDEVADWGTFEESEEEAFEDDQVLFEVGEELADKLSTLLVP